MEWGTSCILTVTWHFSRIHFLTLLGRTDSNRTRPAACCAGQAAFSNEEGFNSSSWKKVAISSIFLPVKQFTDLRIAPVYAYRLHG